MKNNLVFKYGPSAAVMVAAMFSAFLLSIYIPKTLLGNFDHHILSSKMFGVPAELRQHGISELYQKHDSGWDGQFYYYISNDPLAQKDTPKHIDAAAYRYQRIGLPLLANLVSRSMFQDWVSPSIYYLTSFVLMLIATFMAAIYFRRRGFNPFWAIGWALGFGTQVTLLNGLPDAAADALLIIAILSFAQSRVFIYSITITFAALSREAYVLMPAFMGLYSCYVVARQRHGNEPRLAYSQSLCAYAGAILPHIPALVAIAGWQFYLRQHFGVAPSSQAAGILGLPFVSTFRYLFHGLSGKHPLNKEAAILLIYAALLYKSFYLALTALRKEFSARSEERRMIDTNLAGFYFSVLAIITLYTAFGPTVMMHHTGYLKAANIFLFVVPFTMAHSQERAGIKSSTWLIGVLVALSIILMWQRANANPNYGIYIAPEKVTLAESEPTCVGSPQAKLSLINEAPRPAIADSFWRWTRSKLPVIYQVEIHNTSDEIFSPYYGKGSVNLSYQWLSLDHVVVKDGVRTLLSSPLAPGEKAIRPVVVEFPSKPGAYLLRFSLVQEGCFWFYGKNPSSANDIRYKVE